MARFSPARVALALALVAVVAGVEACCSSRSTEPSSPERQAAAAPVSAADRPLALLVRGEPGSKPTALGIAHAEVSVLIASGLATTTLDLTFRNDLDRVLEGELVLPLPEGAAVSSFSLEVGGTLRAASVVERDKARATFEQVVRRGVDPGLVEWVQGNAFRTRIYPIPARGTKRVALSWDEPLAASGPAGLRYRLPLDLAAAAERIAVSVEVVGASTAGVPVLTLANARVECSPGLWRATGELVGSRKLHLALDVPLSLTTPLVLREPSARTPGEDVFVVSAWAPSPQPGSRPSSVTVLYDASLRALRRDRSAERAYFAALAHELELATVRLVLFSDDVWGPAETFEVKRGESPALLERLAAVVPDGALRLSGLDVEKLAGDSPLVLLVSDGLSSLGESEPAPPRRSGVVAVSSGPGDARALGRIARGRVVALDGLSPRDAVARTLDHPWVLDEPKAQGVSQLAGAWSRPIAGGRVSIAGHVPTGVAGEVEIRFTLDHDLSVTRRVSIPATPTSTSGLVERLWALARLSQLEDAGPGHDAEIVALAKAHGLVTPLTSLLVLETLDDYVRYRVEPPADLRAAWAERLRVAETTVARSSDDRLAALRKAATARHAWWSLEPAALAALAGPAPVSSGVQVNQTGAIPAANPVAAATATSPQGGGRTGGVLTFGSSEREAPGDFPGPELGLPQNRGPGPEVSEGQRARIAEMVQEAGVNVQARALTQAQQDTFGSIGSLEANARFNKLQDESLQDPLEFEWIAESDQRRREQLQIAAQNESDFQGSERVKYVDATVRALYKMRARRPTRGSGTSAARSARRS